MPKICWVLGLSLIWNRGSSLGSVESMTSSRPSSGVLLSSRPKLTRTWIPLSFWESSAALAQALARQNERGECDRQDAGRDGQPQPRPTSEATREAFERWVIVFSFQLVNIVQDSRWDADGQHGQLADGFVPGSPGHVDDDSAVQLDHFVVEDHACLDRR